MVTMRVKNNEMSYGDGIIVFLNMCLLHRNCLRFKYPMFPCKICTWLISESHYGYVLNNLIKSLVKMLIVKLPGFSTC